MRCGQHVGAVKEGTRFVSDPFGQILVEGVTARTELEQTAFVPESRTSVDAIGRALVEAPAGFWWLGRLRIEGSAP